MSLKYDVETHPYMYAKKFIDAVENYKNGEKNSKRELYKYVTNRTISEHYYKVLIERYELLYKTNKSNKKASGSFFCAFSKLFLKKKPIDELSRAIEVLMKHNNIQTQKNVFDIFRKYVEEGKWVFSRGKIENERLSTILIQENGKNYVSIYTDTEQIENGKQPVIQTDINKYIEALFDSKEISGLVVNPGSQNFHIEKEYILKILLHDKFTKENNAGSPQKNWGKGIPAHKESDLMTKGEKLNFAMQLVYDYDLKNSEFTIVSCCDNSYAIVNYILEKNGEIFFVIVYPYGWPKAPAFEGEVKTSILKLCRKFNARCLFAPVGVYSCDEERAAANLFLKGDGFYVNYFGMKEVEE